MSRIRFDVAVFLILILAISKGAETLQAQGQADNMRLLMEQLRNRIANESEFKVAIRFAIPLIPDEDVVWVIPDKLETDTDEISRAISEIGDDYTCFDVIGGAARFIECTPFSNIVSIRYFVQ
jgi:hypothetical protein